MHPPLLYRLSHAVRRDIFQDYLGNGSMSIALLRQTCSDIRSEIDNACRTVRYGDFEPCFERQVNHKKLDGCTLAVIESAVGRIEAKNIDVYHWDALFQNAVRHEHWNDIDRLLDIFVFPSSSIFPCMTGSMSMLHALGDARTKQVDSFVQVISKCDNQKIQHHFARLPCNCIRKDFVYSAIRQSLFTVLYAIPSVESYISTPNFYRGDTWTHPIGEAVGFSGNAEMLNYIVGILNPVELETFYTSCFVAAAGVNHVSLLRLLDVSQQVRHTAFVGAVVRDCKDVVQHLLYTPLPARVISSCLLFAARAGNSTAFRFVLSLQEDASSTEWRELLSGKLLSGTQSLAAAWERSPEDLAFFMDFYRAHLPSLLAPKNTDMPLLTRAVDKKTWKTWTAILEQCDFETMSRLDLFVQNVLKFMDVGARQVYLDTLHFLLSRRERFRLDLVNDIIEQLLSCLATQPLTIEEAKETTRVAFTNEAYDWVTQHFGVTITADDATVFLSRLSDWPLLTNYELHTNYFLRCIKLGARFEPGRSNVVHTTSLLLGIPTPHTKLDFDCILPIFEKVVHSGRLNLVQKFVAAFKVAQCPPELWSNRLRYTCLANNQDSMARSTTSGCFSMGAMNAFSTGHMRLYHYACKLLGMTPKDPQKIPSEILMRRTETMADILGHL